ncbi:hypothetical protein AAP_05701 [Ascosphaera apis ARSEF 7405]|uniref:Uncharacterized protein n=1 Tax=Ascosphaera apis ARSEF 7405 TaxID=392613 RepID=A0A166N2K3_9EURO|nr:hypothetical protein AAP_05701 [Ascosphaera apis ARSEF 7405]
MSATHQMTTVQPDLSGRDIAVLQALLDQEPTAARSAPIAHDKEISLPMLEDEVTRNLREREKAIISKFQLAKNGGPTSVGLQEGYEGLTQLSVIIEEYPRYSSAYVNRAQISRLMIENGHIRVDDVLRDMDNGRPQLNPFNDLREAISLSRGQGHNSPAPISKFQAEILQSAYTHRGLIFLKASDITASAENNIFLKLLPEALQKMSPSQLESIANEDFNEGAYFGSSVARHMAVRTNPYAKACGAIVKQAMEEEASGA